MLLDPDNFHLAGRDLSGRFVVTSRDLQAALVAGAEKWEQHSSSAAHARSQGRSIPSDNALPVGKAHRCVPISRRLQLAAKAAHSAAVGFFNPSSAVVGVKETAHGLAILLDELTGVELGVDHHGVRRGVPEQRLDDVQRRVVVQMF
jgi:hypothetical protein